MTTGGERRRPEEPVTLLDTWPGTGGVEGVYRLAGEPGWWRTVAVSEGEHVATVEQVDAEGRAGERRQVGVRKLPLEFRPGRDRPPETTEAEQLRADVLTVARYIVGWWPALEDPIYTVQEGGAVGEHAVLEAARRVLAALDEESAGLDKGDRGREP